MGTVTVETKSSASSIRFLRLLLLERDTSEAAEILRELKQPDLAVLDVVMPHLGGAATAAQLLMSLPGLPILFTSGFSENANNAVAQVPGSHYLQKPYGPTSLASTIREILES